MPDPMPIGGNEIYLRRIPNGDAMAIVRPAPIPFAPVKIFKRSARSGSAGDRARPDGLPSS